MVTRRTILLGVLVAVMMALFATPALAAYRTDSGGPVGPCGAGERSAHLALKYEGDAYLTYRNAKGTYFNVPLPYHSFSYTNFRDTNQNELRWWRIEIVSNNGYVSRQGSYGFCGR